MKRRSVALIAAFAALSFTVGHWVRQALQIDSCLDNGWSWSHEHAACHEHGQMTPTAPNTAPAPIIQSR